MNENRTQLRAFVERIERLEEEAKAINDDKKEVYAEAKGSGFDTKVLKRIIADRRKDANDRANFEAIYDLYASELGMVTSHVQAHVREGAEMDWQSPRTAPLGDLKDAYRAGKPISQDFEFENASVYFFAFPEINRVKIGVSNDVTGRLDALEKETNIAGAVLHYRPGNRQVEMAMHEAFSEWHIEGEWFRDCRGLRQALSDLPDATRAPAHEAA